MFAQLSRAAYTLPNMLIDDRNPTGRGLLHRLRLWVLPTLVAALIGGNFFFANLDSIAVTAAAAAAIGLFGIPHGTLDVEIAAQRFGRSSLSGKAQIIAAYLACAASMGLCWYLAPGMALALFLIISIVHFSQDWQSGAEPFLAMMVAWALISLPALSHPEIVSDIFALLTGSASGQTIAALLAMASAPAALGSLVYAFWTYRNGQLRDAVEVISCLVAALLLPPLIAFAIFFCGLHSPRHMAAAMDEAGALGNRQKLAIIIAVTLLSFGLGALLFANQGAIGVEANIIRTAFILISILTVPHFILEHILAKAGK